MAVTFVGTGAVDSAGAPLDQRDITPGLPAGWAENDIFTAALQTRAQDGSGVAAPDGWTEIDNTFNAISGGWPRLQTFWRRATSSESAPTFATATLNNASAVITAWRGVKLTGDPWNVKLETNNAGTTTATAAGVTTTVNGCMIFVAFAADNNGTYSALTNASLASISEAYNFNHSFGTDGMQCAAYGILTTAGASGDTTVTNSMAISSAAQVIALEPQGEGGTETTVTPSAPGTVTLPSLTPTPGLSANIIAAAILSSGTQIRLTANRQITASIGDGGGTDFVLDGFTGGAVTMSFASGLPGTQPLYNLSRTISADETDGELDYTQPGNGLEAVSNGDDVVSFTNLVVTNGSTVGGRTATPGASIGAPGDVITFTLTGFSGAPTGATLNGVAVTIDNEAQTSVDVILPALDDFALGEDHAATEWNTSQTVVISEAGGSASASIQIAAPDVDGPTYWFGVCANVDGVFPAESSVFPTETVTGDSYFVEVLTGTVTSVRANGAIQASTSVFDVESRIWDESQNSGAGGWSDKRRYQFYAMDSLVAPIRNRRWAFKRF